MITFETVLTAILAVYIFSVLIVLYEHFKTKSNSKGHYIPPGKRGKSKKGSKNGSKTANKKGLSWPPVEEE
jgi:hypothetical protein